MGTKVKILFTITKRRNVPVVINMINQYNPNAFYTIEEIKAVRDGYFGMPRNRAFGGMVKRK
jgi:uncharacterized membrane-anchored protein YitT (DUF2179 family)